MVKVWIFFGFGFVGLLDFKGILYFFYWIWEYPIVNLVLFKFLIVGFWRIQKLSLLCKVWWSFVLFFFGEVDLEFSLLIVLGSCYIDW
jgi:hypothetical protein